MTFLPLDPADITPEIDVLWGQIMTEYRAMRDIEKDIEKLRADAQKCRDRQAELCQRLNNEIAATRAAKESDVDAHTSDSALAAPKIPETASGFNDEYDVIELIDAEG